MKEEIFIDTYLLTNWLLNLACLYTAQIISGGQTTALRLLCSSFAGAIYAVFALLVRPPGMIGVLAWLLVLVGMVYWVNFPTGPARLAKASLLCCFLATALGGILEALQNLFLPLGYKTTLVAIIVGCGLCITGIRLLFLIVWQKANVKRVRLIVDLGTNVLELSGLVDSGNLLCEPITGSPVILISARHQNDPILAQYFQGCAQNNKNFYIIPAKTASGNMLVYGMRPKSVTICLPGRKDYRPDRVMIAADSRTPHFADCDCLVPSALIP